MSKCRCDDTFFVGECPTHPDARKIVASPARSPEGEKPLTCPECGTELNPDMLPQDVETLSDRDMYHACPGCGGEPDLADQVIESRRKMDEIRARRRSTEESTEDSDNTAEELLRETIRQVHDVGWANAVNSCRKKDVNKKSLDSSREAVQVLQWEGEQLLSRAATPGTPGWKIERDPDGNVYITHPWWSLVGQGKTLVEAAKDLEGEIPATLAAYTDGSEITERAQEMVEWLKNVGTEGSETKNSQVTDTPIPWVTAHSSRLCPTTYARGPDEQEVTGLRVLVSRCDCHSGARSRRIPQRGARRVCYVPRIDPRPMIPAPHLPGDTE